MSKSVTKTAPKKVTTIDTPEVIALRKKLARAEKPNAPESVIAELSDYFNDAGGSRAFADKTLVIKVQNFLKKIENMSASQVLASVMAEIDAEEAEKAAEKASGWNYVKAIKFLKKHPEYVAGEKRVRELDDQYERETDAEKNQAVWVEMEKLWDELNAKYIAILEKAGVPDHLVGQVWEDATE
jgi:hypothetical protein